jgi:hypothetical protein
MNNNSHFKDILLIVTAIFLVFFVAVFAWVWTDRNYAAGSPWPTIWTIAGIVVAVSLLGLWLYYWLFKK